MDAVVYDEITTQVGKKDDAADDTGSLHAKVADLKASVMPTQVKSWQRVTGNTPATNGTLTLSLSTVDPSKCIVLVDGCRYGILVVGEATYSVPLMHYVSAFSASSITLSIGSSGGVASQFIASTVSVIIVELY